MSNNNENSDSENSSTFFTRKRKYTSPKLNNCHRVVKKFRSAIVCENNKMNLMDTQQNSSNKKQRPNFSAVNNSNGPTATSVMKMPSTNPSKPGDIRKLVIKNFKSKYIITISTYIFIYFFL